MGSRSAKIAFVGEAWGAHEEMFRSPLVWWSGVELARMLSEAKLTRPFELPRKVSVEPYMTSWWQSTGFFFTNVFAARPPNNELEAWCESKPNGTPMFKAGKYFAPELMHHVSRLFKELEIVRPNLIVAMGATASWALLGTSTISKLRGAVAYSVKASCKVLPTWHPAYILRQWDARVVGLQDLIKAKREAAFPEIRRPERQIKVDPSLDYIRMWRLRAATHYAVDIETKRGQIEMISFARSRSDSIVIPFILPNGKNYWPTREEEVLVWREVQAMLEEPSIIKVFQNGLYDLFYLARMGFKPKNCSEDTMLLHHSLFPELRKGLDFLGSIYTDEAAWKLLRTRAKDDMLKREE